MPHKLKEDGFIYGCGNLAEFLGVHPNTISRWRYKGLLDKATVFDNGRTVIFSKNEVMRLRLKP